MISLLQNSQLRYNIKYIFNILKEQFYLLDKILDVYTGNFFKKNVVKNVRYDEKFLEVLEIEFVY